MRLLQFLKINKRMFRHILLFLNFFLSRSKGQALIASLPRSGTHLTLGMLNVCFSMQEGFSGELAVSDNEYASFVTGEQPFDERSFLRGARTAFEMAVKAFAAGDGCPGYACVGSAGGAQ